MKKLILLVLLAAIYQNSFAEENGTAGVQSIASNSVTVIRFAASGKIWMGTKGGGCLIYDPGTDGWSGINSGNNPAMANDTVTAIELYVSNTVLFACMGTTTGVFIKHGTAWDTLTNLPSQRITGISKTFGNKLCVATTAGIAVYNPDDLTYIGSYTTANSNLPTNSVTATQLRQIGCNGYYGGTYNKGYYYTSDDTVYTVYNSLNNNLLDNRVNCILSDNACNTQYVGTILGLSICSSGTCTNYQVANGLPSNDISTLEVDCRNRLWIGTRTGGLAVYDGTDFTVINTSNGLPSDKITTIRCNASCNCWVGTADNGAVQIDSNLVVSDVPLRISKADAIITTRIYPQPANDIIQFDFVKNISDGKILLYDMFGRNVLTQQIEEGKTTTTNVSSLQEGIYTYTITSGNRPGTLQTGRVIIHR